MFSDPELTILTFYSSRLGLYLLSGVCFFVVALVLRKQREAVANYLLISSILYFLSVLTMPIYAGFAAASVHFNELSFRICSEGIELMAALLLVLNLALLLIGVISLGKTLNSSETSKMS